MIDARSTPHDPAPARGGDRLTRRLFEAGLRVHTLRAVLADETDPFGNAVITAAVHAAFDELEPLPHDLVERDRVIGPP